MLRGVFHLLLYRLVYQLAPFDVANLTPRRMCWFCRRDLSALPAGFGQFHVVVGLLHMFGFNLPETHHLYLLASSFTDFWRRINIYWKDFIMKLFFYPAFFKLRKLGTTRALVLATLLTFFATWLLAFLAVVLDPRRLSLHWQDISFWTILALLVVANAVYEAKTVRRRTLTPSRVTLPTIQAGTPDHCNVPGDLHLWTVWSSQSFEELNCWRTPPGSPRAMDSSFCVVWR
jgi:hypothetical protein